jgi:hypothetical protein
MNNFERKVTGSLLKNVQKVLVKIKQASSKNKQEPARMKSLRVF